MKYFVFYRNSLRDSYDCDPPKVVGIPFKHVATVTCGGLEVLFRQMNVVDGTEIPTLIRNRSMSVGDVAVDETGRGYVCCSAGWDACLHDLVTEPGVKSFTVD